MLSLVFDKASSNGLRLITCRHHYLISKVSVVLEDGSVVGGCPHKILHHVLLLGKAAIKL